MYLLIISVVFCYLSGSFNSSLLKNLSRQCSPCQSFCEETKFNFFITVTNIIFQNFARYQRFCSVIDTASLVVIDKLDRQKRRQCHRNDVTRKERGGDCVFVVPRLPGCTNVHNEICEKKRGWCGVKRREPRTSYGEHEENGKKEGRRERWRNEKSGFFLWCIHVALDRGWSEARADRFGLRSQLPRTLT